MGLAYWLIAARLWRGLRHETSSSVNTNTGSRLQTMMAAAESSAPLENICGSSCTGNDIKDEKKKLRFSDFTFQEKYAGRH